MKETEIDITTADGQMNTFITCPEEGKEILNKP